MHFLGQQLLGRKKIFGTDGVRGKANFFPMTVELALAMGRAAGKAIRLRKGKGKVVIGKDTRLSCYMFENALIAGLCSMGIDTYMLGPFPTPGVAFITRAYRADAGIVISASHNPYDDNGIKFFSSEGYKLPDEWEEEMETMIQLNDFSDSLPTAEGIGRNTKVRDADGRYIEFVKATLPKKMMLNGMKIALDCANGASYRVAPLIFSELDAETYLYGVTPNGLNINKYCGSMYLDQLRAAVLHNRADVGIAFDGDADRVMMLDEQGNIVDGDKILAICACDKMERGELPNNLIVGTVMCNYGIVQSLKERGIDVALTQVGDRYVIQEMLKLNAVLGGEQSGHLIFHEHNTTGDGLVAALQVLKIMQEKKMTLSALAAPFKEYPQVLLNIQVPEKPPLDHLEGVPEAIAHAEKQLGNKGRVLVRYSGTEPKLRVMVEGENKQACESLAKNIKETVDQAFQREKITV